MNRSISRFTFAAIDRECRRTRYTEMTSDTASSHCLFLYFFLSLVGGVAPVVPKDFITRACSKTRRAPIAETSLVQYARRFHNAQVYISRQTRKAPLRPRGTVVAWEGDDTFQPDFITSTGASRIAPLCLSLR